MNTLWTPSGEHSPEDGGPNETSTETPLATPGQGNAAGMAAGAGPDGNALPADELSPQQQEALAQLAAVRDQVANTPAEAIIANHAVGLYELATLHLSIASDTELMIPKRSDHLAQAQLSIDALGSLLDTLKGRLGKDEATIVDALAQLRIAYVQMAESLGDAPSQQDGAES